MARSVFWIGASAFLCLLLAFATAQMSGNDVEGFGVYKTNSADNAGAEQGQSSSSSDEEELPPADCAECDPKTCPPAPPCRAGFQTDACGCCTVCAASEGEKCDLDPSVYRYGSCGDNLECKIRDDIQNPKDQEAICQCTETKLVCGSDGKTYFSICELRGVANVQRGLLKGNNSASAPSSAASAESSGGGGDEAEAQAALAAASGEILTVAQWGPCEEEPRITSNPEDARVEQGGNVALACEAKGWPVPVITWETVRADGSQFILPSDHTTIAVQQRGGPERLMVSGWVQLMDVQPGDGGVYTCIAKNKLGEAKFSANVGIYKETDVQVGSNGNKV